jgi:hypothetical protein
MHRIGTSSAPPARYLRLIVGHRRLIHVAARGFDAGNAAQDRGCHLEPQWYVATADAGCQPSPDPESFRAVLFTKGHIGSKLTEPYIPDGRTFLE